MWIPRSSKSQVNKLLHPPLQLAAWIMCRHLLQSAARDSRRIPGRLFEESGKKNSGSGLNTVRLAVFRIYFPCGHWQRCKQLRREVCPHVARNRAVVACVGGMALLEGTGVLQPGRAQSLLRRMKTAGAMRFAYWHPTLRLMPRAAA